MATEAATPSAASDLPAPAQPASGEIWGVASETGHRLGELKMQIAEAILGELGPDFVPDAADEAACQALKVRFLALLAIHGPGHGPVETEQLWEAVHDELIGFGPIEPLLRDERVTEVMVNGPDLVYAEVKGRLRETDVRFADAGHVMRIIWRILKPLGRRVERKWPMVDARLPDGSRVNAIIPPCALNGPTLTIRKFSKKPLTVSDLVRFGSLTSEMAEFLRVCVLARMNVVVAGGTGSGKTTLLNVLSSFIPDDERIVTIEDSAELQLRQRHVVTLEARPPDPDGTGKVAIRDLVVNSLRMRPERIVVGECRSGEALDMLQAMNTGHDGSLTTLHANTPRDAISRLETMCMMSGMNLPMSAIRGQIAAAIDLIVLQSRMRDGSRKVTSVTEVQGMEGEIVVLQDVFVFKEAGIDAQGKVIGEIKPTGLRPKFMEKLEAKGISLPAEVFGITQPDSAF
ncbi:MAG: CpaF family protein [Chloroflexota bacterium]